MCLNFVRHKKKHYIAREIANISVNTKTFNCFNTMKKYNKSLRYTSDHRLYYYIIHLVPKLA